MNRQNIIFVSLLLIAATAMVAVGYATGRGPLAVISGGVSQITSGRQMIPWRSVTEETKGPRPPKFRAVMDQFRTAYSHGLAWSRRIDRILDVRVLQLSQRLAFDQKVGCSVSGQGLAIIGVHTPELDYESNVDNLRREVAGLGINYPVVTDNDYSTWKAYKVEAWPTLFVLDKQGRVRWTHVGEGYMTQPNK